MPESYRGGHRPQGRGADVRRDAHPREGPPQVAAPRRGARSPSSARARRWSPSWPRRSTTTPCGPRSSSRCRRSASSSATAAPTPLAKRHDLPYHVVGSDLSGVVLRTGPGVQRLEARRRGRRPLPERRAGEPRRPQRHDDGPGAADLGLRDQLRRPGRDRPGQVQPADAQARST